MVVPNELIGNVIGKRGARIANIRWVILCHLSRIVRVTLTDLFCFRAVSGAMIRISEFEVRDFCENKERTIFISGTAHSVALAQKLIEVQSQQ